MRRLDNDTFFPVEDNHTPPPARNDLFTRSPDDMAARPQGGVASRSPGDFTLRPEDRPSVRTTTDSDMRAAEEMALWIASSATQRASPPRWQFWKRPKKHSPALASFATQQKSAPLKAPSPQIILPQPIPQPSQALVPHRPPSRIRRFFRKRGAAIIVISLMATGGIWEWKTQMFSQTATNFYSEATSLSSSAGLTVKDIYVSGRVYTKSEEIMAALGIRWGDPIFQLNLDEAKQRLEALPWVKKAALDRQLSGTIHINIVERVPIAIWQNDGHFFLVDAEGEAIGEFRDNLYSLPLVVGANANKHVASLLAILREEPQLMERVKAAVWIGDRRWNLVFDDINNGLNVRLPEDGTAEAWKRLASLDREQKILDRALTMIDLRLPDRMILGVSPQAVPKIPPPSKTKDRDI